MSIRKIFKLLILTGILLTPIFNFSEVYALLTNTMSLSVSTPVYVKIIKDLMFLLVIYIGLLTFLMRPKIPASVNYLIFCFFAISSMVISFFLETSMVAFFSGLRWLMPILVLFFIYKSVDEKFQADIANIMGWLLVLGLSLQVFELFHMQKWYGGLLGLSIRNPGFYFVPTSMAMFSLSAMYYSWNYMRKGILRSMIIFPIGPLSVLLTASGTGIIVLLLFYSVPLFFKIKQKMAVVFVMAIVLAGVLWGLPQIANRRDIYTSIFERIEIFSGEMDMQKLILSDSFGSATNTAVNADKFNSVKSSDSLIVDSTVTSIMYNIGILPAIVFILFLFKYIQFNSKNLQFWAVNIPFMLTVVVFELFPMNLLLAVNLAYFHGYRSEKKELK